MATAVISCSFSGTDFTRTYQSDIADSVSTADIKSAVNAINASLEAGTSGGMDSFFLKALLLSYIFMKWTHVIIQNSLRPPPLHASRAI